MPDFYAVTVPSPPGPRTWYRIPAIVSQRPNGLGANTYAGIDLSSIANLLHKDLAAAIGIVGTLRARVDVQINEYSKRLRRNVVTSKFPLDVEIVDDAGFANYQHVGPGQTELLIGEALNQFLRDAKPYRNGLFIQFEESLVSC